MTVIMKAREAADDAYALIKSKVAAMKEKGIQPLMATIFIEGDPASAYYAQAKQKIAGKLGVAFRLHALQMDVSEEAVLQLIDQLNLNPDVHGIMLELSLPPHLSASRIEQAISPSKDVDGVSPANKLATMTGAEGLYPATPQACIRLLKHYGYSLEGKNVTLIGRGQTVGMPLFHILQREQATVTVCHSRTPDITSHLRHAEIVFVAVGRPDTVTSDMVHNKIIVIDAGINEREDGGITGDAAPDIDQYAAAVSPVPGGVGTLTTAILYENLMRAVAMQCEEARI